MTRCAAVVLGALTFLVAHFVLVTGWTSWFDPAGQHTPWFLNTGRAVAFTVVCLLVVSAAWSALTRGESRDRVGRGAAFAAGAVVAMAGVLFSGGPGTLFPIVLVIGTALLMASGIGGAIAGGALRTALSRR